MNGTNKIKKEDEFEAKKENFEIKETVVDRETCSYQLKMKDYMEEVNALMINNDGVWECIKCGYFSRSKDHATEHVMKHVQGYTFPCDLCKYTSTNAANLRCHKRRCHKPTTKKQITV